MRKIKVEKDSWAPADQFAKQLQETMGIVVIYSKRDGENFEFTFDRNLALEDIEKIQTLLSQNFPGYKITEQKDGGAP